MDIGDPQDPNNPLNNPEVPNAAVPLGNIDDDAENAFLLEPDNPLIAKI